MRNFLGKCDHGTTAVKGLLCLVSLLSFPNTFSHHAGPENCGTLPAFPQLKLDVFSHVMRLH